MRLVLVRLARGGRAAAVTVVTVCVLTLALTASVSFQGVAVTASASQRLAAAPHKPHAPRTVIRVRSGGTTGDVPTTQTGVNHRYAHNAYGTWDASADRPNRRVLRRLRAAGITMVRFPGGTVANLFDWKKSIGNTASRGCQTEGHHRPAGFGAVKGLAYGPDEHMRFIHRLDAKALVMVPWATETPEDAAEFVEYMNSPNDGPGGSNPNGGVDWALRRAENGHSAPYRIRMWEIGNEHWIKKERYWMSRNTGRAMRQYLHGDTVRIADENLGRNCRHPDTGVASDGLAGQDFQVLYPPVVAPSLRVTVGSDPARWSAVSPADLSLAAGDAKVFALDPENGKLTFGDGTHGAIPDRGSKVHATYRSTHESVFAFIRAMRQVDSSIRVCPTWDSVRFLRAARGHGYNCFSVHSYTDFRRDHRRNWRSALQGHDLNMRGTETQRRFLTRIRRALPNGAPLAVSEFGAIWGNSRVYPNWASSMTHALYMASMWARILDSGIRWACGSDMTAASQRGMLGRPPRFLASAEALTRKALRPMYGAGKHRLSVSVAHNPLRDPKVPWGRYPALAVAATRGSDGVHVMVVNRLPNREVRARVSLGKPSTRGRGFVTRVTGRSFRSRNTLSRPHTVHLRRTRKSAGRHSLEMDFPAHSVTVLRIPMR